MGSAENVEASWRRRARAFAETEIAPRVHEIDRDDRLPTEMFARLAASGLMGLGLPEKFGGTTAGVVALAAVLEELAAQSAAIATLLSVHLSVCAMPIARYGTEAQQRKFLEPLARGKALGAFALSEPGVGSDPAHLSCAYRVANGGYRLRGSKMFITNAGSAGVILAFATKDTSLGHRGISAFVVPGGIPGLSVAQRLDKMGIRGSETTELVFDDVELPKESLLGKEGEGLSIALGSLTDGRVGIAACALGVARAAFEALRQSASQDPADWKRAMVARAFVELSGARALVERAARLKDAGEPFVEASSSAKLFASQTAFRIASAAFGVAGPEAGRAISLFSRLLRDARVFPIVEGTTEIQELILGRALLDRQPSS